MRKLFCLFFIGFWVINAYSQKVTVRVMDDRHNKPLESARVEWVKLKDSSIVFDGITSGGGYCSFLISDTGSYNIRVNLKGYDMKDSRNYYRRVKLDNSRFENFVIYMVPQDSRMKPVRAK